MAHKNNEARSAEDHTAAHEVSKAASHLADEAREMASHVTTSAQDLVKAEVEKRTSRGADELSEVARALRKSGRDLKGNIAAPYVQKAAEQIDHASDYLRTADPNDLLETVSTFAKREPVLFLSGAFAVGLLGSRFMKSGRPADRKSTPSAVDLSARRASGQRSA